MRRKSVLYALMKPFVNWAIRLFYRNLHVRNAKVVCDADAPILLISNHQNALMDPLLCCITSPRQLNFLTRADVFKKPWAKKILFSLNMLPVYRPHDKVNILESNAPTFKESLRRLEDNQIISLFPEGTHQPDQNLKPFKKGAARLIGDVFDSGKNDKIIIQPVGIHYLHIQHSGFPGFIQFGEPSVIHASDLNLNPDERRKEVARITQDLQKSLEDYVIHLDEGEKYIKRLFIYRAVQWANLFSQKGGSIPAFKEVESSVEARLQELDSFNIDELKVVENAFKFPALVLVANEQLMAKFGRKLILISPICIIGFLVTAIPYFIGKALTKKLVKDVCFTSTAKVVLGSVLITLFWILQSIILFSLFNPLVGLLATALMVTCGALFLKYHTSFRIFYSALKERRNKKMATLVGIIRELTS